MAVNKTVLVAFLALFAFAAVASAYDCHCYAECANTNGTIIIDQDINQPCSNCTLANCDALCPDGAIPGETTTYCPGAFESLAKGIIAAIVIGCILVFIIMPLAICFCCGLACFAGRGYRTVTYVNVPSKSYGTGYA